MLLAATNYPERIDDALMRSGRFSRQINIEYPEYEERKHLVDYYLGQLNIPLEEDATIPNITNLTDGLSPADIKEISNEAAIMAIRYKQVEIKIDYINEAINKVITKNIRKPDSPDVDYKLIAAHECGHVLAEYLYDKSIPIKVTNYSYGNAGGFTQSASRLEGILPKEQFLNRVKTLLAGRAAEEVICGYITNGASNDLEKAKKILKAYYKYYNFEYYEAKDLDQLILKDLHKYYDEVKTLFETECKDVLEHLTNELTSKRIMYKKDILGLYLKFKSTGGMIL
jgi:cell division protease FtsH